MVREIEMNAKVDCSVSNDVGSVMIDPSIELCCSITYILFSAFSARD